MRPRARSRMQERGVDVCIGFAVQTESWPAAQMFGDLQLGTMTAVSNGGESPVRRCAVRRRGTFLLVTRIATAPRNGAKAHKTFELGFRPGAAARAQLAAAFFSFREGVS